MKQLSTAVSVLPDSHSWTGQGGDWSVPFVAFLRSGERGRVRFDGRGGRRNAGVAMVHPDFVGFVVFSWCTPEGVHLVPCWVAKWGAGDVELFSEFSEICGELMAVAMEVPGAPTFRELGFTWLSPEDARNACRLLMASYRLGQH